MHAQCQCFFVLFQFDFHLLFGATGITRPVLCLYMLCKIAVIEFHAKAGDTNLLPLTLSRK